MIQAKLRVGSATDPAEAEADEFADVVMRRLRDRSDDEIAMSTFGGAVGRIRRRTSGVDVGADGGELSPETERRIASPSAGSSLPGDVRASMGEAIGADLSAVRIHTDATAADLNSTIGARAFTSGNHIHFSSGSFQPSTADGQHLLAHELGHTVQQGRIRRRHVGGAQMVYRYADVPGPATWKTDSKEDSSSRSSELKRIDAGVAQYDALRNGTDTAGKRSALAEISDAIFGWESKKYITARKQDAGYQNARTTKVGELKAIVAQKSVDSSDEHAIELAPLVASYLKSASAGNFEKTRRLGAELYAAHADLFQRTATQALQSTNNRLWATIFFGVPPKALGTPPHIPSTLKTKPDFNWLTAKWADAAIDSFIIPMSTGTSKTFVMQMLQVSQFRQGLQARATAQTYQRLQDLMPIVRIADTAEVSARVVNQAPTNEQLADAVFAAFLGDQQNTDLKYLTNTVGFDTSKFMLGDATALLRAPCMTLSNLMTEVIKAVVPQNAADGVAVPMSNTKPMLTKPLAQIGTNGILTKDASFYGNVKEFGNVVGFQNVNRIFFSNGHEWLQIGNKEYDPTLGISGPIGTVESQVELLFTGAGSKFVSEDTHHKAKAEKVNPPGGKAMKFNRTWKIT